MTDSSDKIKPPDLKANDETPSLTVPEQVLSPAPLSETEPNKSDEASTDPPAPGSAGFQPAPTESTDSSPKNTSEDLSEPTPSPSPDASAPKTTNPSLGKSFSIVAGLTIFSKVIGLVRDMVVAGFYGAGPLADAYNTAYLFTGQILILFGGLGGPFHSATVTILTPRKDDPKSGRLMFQVMLATGVILAVVAGTVYLAAPLLVHLAAPNYGLDNPDVLKRSGIHDLFASQTVLQLRVMSPLITIAGLIGITYGILNVYNKLFWPSVSPIIASVAIIIALWLFPDKTSSWPVAVGSLVGAFGQLFAQLPGMFQCNLQYKFDSKPAEGLRQYLSILWPAIIGTSIGQIITSVDLLFSFQIPDGQGAWTAVSNANRIIQLPLGVLITAMLVPILPRLTQHVADNKPEQVKFEFRRALSFLWFISMPLSMILFVIPEPIVRALYQRHAWDERATLLVVSALIFQAPSIVIYIGRDLITRVFYAYQDTKTPYYVGMAAIFVKAVLDWLFVIVLDMRIAGIALATTLITLFNFTFLMVLLARKTGSLGASTLIKPFAIMLGATIAAALCTHYGYTIIASYIPPPDPTGNVLTLIKLLGAIAVTSGVGLLVYGGICFSLKLEEPYMLLRRLKLIPPKL